MTEKNILAYFHSPEQAQGRPKLEALRVEDLSINRFSRYAGVGPSGHPTNRGSPAVTHYGYLMRCKLIPAQVLWLRQTLLQAE